MRRVIQLTDAGGTPTGGHTFDAQDLAALDASMKEAGLVEGGNWFEVTSEADLVVPPDPTCAPVDELGQTGDGAIATSA